MQEVPVAVLVERVDNLKDMMGELKEVMEQGFKDTHEKQDKTNGRIRKLEAWRNIMVGGLIVSDAILLPIAFMLLAKVIDRIL